MATGQCKVSSFSLYLDLISLDFLLSSRLLFCWRRIASSDVSSNSSSTSPTVTSILTRQAGFNRGCSRRESAAQAALMTRPRDAGSTISEVRVGWKTPATSFSRFGWWLWMWSTDYRNLLYKHQGLRLLSFGYLERRVGWWRVRLGNGGIDWKQKWRKELSQ